MVTLGRAGTDSGLFWLELSRLSCYVTVCQYSGFDELVRECLFVNRMDRSKL